MENKIDFKFLKRTLILLFVALVLSTAFYFIGNEYETSSFEKFQAAKSSLSNSHARYVKLVEDLDRLQLYTEKYNEYRDSGLVGKERRLSWIETLESVNSVLKLPKLAYTLLPQESFNRPRLKVDNKVMVNSTPMKLDMDVLHEEDIFAVFEGIDGTIENLFTIDSCKLSRKNRGNFTVSTKGSNLSATCLMRWVTVDAAE